MKKILFVCKANVTRSPIAKVIFEKKLKALGLEDKCVVETAGMIRASQDTSPFTDIALSRAGYASLGNHRPKQLEGNLVENSDLILTINSTIYERLNKAWENKPSRRDKLRVLPHYGTLVGKAPDDIFDPRYILVSPEDYGSKSEPVLKTLAREIMQMRNGLGDFIVDKFTPYVPFTENSAYTQKIISLYQRTINELEPIIDGTIERMKRDGFLD